MILSSVFGSVHRIVFLFQIIIIIIYDDFIYLGQEKCVMDIEELAEETPVFNVNQAQRATGLGREYLREKLSRMVRDGRLYRIERGKYTAQDDPVVYATHIETPSYISYWSGLSFFGLTPQQPAKIQVATSRSRKDLEKISFIKTPGMYGFRRERYRDFEITVAEREKLLIDILSTGKVPVEETRELVEEVDTGKTVEYLERLGSKAVSRRAGYLLEKIRGERVEELREQDRNYPLLDLTKTDKGEKHPYWRIKVNNDAI